MDSLTKAWYEPSALKDSFVKRYGGDSSDVHIFSSPARINIIGEHIDYNGGMVFPAAINRYLYVAIRKRPDAKIIYNDLRFDGSFEFTIHDTFVFDKKNDYANYLNGILSQLKAKGYTFDAGFEILMASNIPAGGGISSSSALECGFAYAISELYGFHLSRIDIAKLGQMSEHTFMNVNCGIMDQFIIAMGKKDTAIALNCDTLEYEYAPLQLGDWRFVIMNTNKIRRLADSKYNERRAQCEEALALLQQRGVRTQNGPLSALCQLTPEEFESSKAAITDPILLKRAKHCVYENQRVKDAIGALKNQDLPALGRLLCQSHASLKDDYEVTGLELDTLASAAATQDGCLGARMTGAGFGGCAIALVHKDATDAFVRAVQETYTQTVGYGAGFFVCESGDGVAKLA